MNLGYNFVMVHGGGGDDGGGGGGSGEVMVVRW